MRLFSRIWSRELVYHTVDEQEWAHRLRMCWREFLWAKCARDRPQHYGDVQEVDYRRTMLLHDDLEKVANAPARDGDVGLTLQQEESRKKVAVLRLLLAGGLMTEERDARHKRVVTNTDCDTCGVPKTLYHVSWECQDYEELREPVLAELGCTVESLPICTRYAGIIPQRLDMDDTQVRALQLMLVEIWQMNIERFHDKQQHYQKKVRLAMERQEGAGSAQFEENGHVLEPRVGQEGVWCRKCGKFVTRLKHVRLKITGSKCVQKDLPVGEWLQAEGFFRSGARLDALQQEMQRKYNTGGHILQWNRKLGKEAGSADEGLIFCRRCGARWRWRNRMSMRHTVCNPEMRTRRNGPDLRPKFRLTKKSDAATVLFRDPCVAVPPANVPEGDPPNHSSSSSHPFRAGVG